MMIHPSDIEPFLEEDIGTGDLTALIIPAEIRATAEVITRDRMVMCGQPWFDAIFQHIDPSVFIQWFAQEGALIEPGTVLCRIDGFARALLTGERAALNLLQTLAATATTSKTYADAISGTPLQVLDTRKTIPGLRKAQKYAVRCGGCKNHRMGLYDGILIKENHILAAGSITAAIEQARSLGADIPVEVEVETLTELKEALTAGADQILLDNFSIAQIREAVAITGGKAKLEVSGNADVAFVKAIAQTGVDYVSVGALTKNILAIDLSMRIKLLT